MWRIVPLPPTTHPSCGEMNDKPYMGAWVSMGCGLHCDAAVYCMADRAVDADDPPLLVVDKKHARQLQRRAAGLFFPLLPAVYRLENRPARARPPIPRLASRKYTLMSVTSVPVFWEAAFSCGSAAFMDGTMSSAQKQREETQSHR